LNKISIATRLWLGFGLVVLLLLGAVGVATQGFQGAAGSLAQVKKQSDQIILAKDAHQHIVQTTAFVGALAAAQDDQTTQFFTQRILAEREVFTALLDQIRPLNISEESRRLFAEIETTLAAVKESNAQVLELAKAGRHAEAGALFDAASGPKIAALNAAFEQYDAMRKGRLTGALDDANVAIRRSTLLVLLEESRTSMEGGMAAVDGTQRQLGRIQQAIQGMSGEMRNISTATAEQAYSAEEVAQRVDGVSREISQNAAATQQMTATVQEIARTAGSLAQVSEAMSIAVAQFQV